MRAMSAVQKDSGTLYRVRVDFYAEDMVTVARSEYYGPYSAQGAAKGQATSHTNAPVSDDPVDIQRWINANSWSYGASNRLPRLVRGFVEYAEIGEWKEV